MKYLLLTTLFIASAFQMFAQEETIIILKKDEATKDYYYEEVIKTNGITQQELFNRSKAWILANMKTADNNITFDEKNFSSVNTGAIKIDPKSYFTVAIHDGAFDFKFHVWCKDDRYKIRVDNIMYYIVYGHGGKTYSRSTYSYADLPTNQRGDNLRDQGNTKILAFVDLFKKDMEKSPTELKTNDNW